MNYSYEINIIKIDDEDDYYAAVKFDYDDENTLSIIGSGKNEIEAIKEAMAEIIVKYNNCLKALTKMGEVIINKEFYLGEDFELNSKDIKKEADFGYHIRHKFDALHCDPETKTWGRYYR